MTTAHYWVRPASVSVLTPKSSRFAAAPVNAVGDCLVLELLEQAAECLVRDEREGAPCWLAMLDPGAAWAHHVSPYVGPRPCEIGMPLYGASL